MQRQVSHCMTLVESYMMVILQKAHTTSHLFKKQNMNSLQEAEYEPLRQIQDIEDMDDLIVLDGQYEGAIDASADSAPRNEQDSVSTAAAAPRNEQESARNEECEASASVERRVAAHTASAAAGGGGARRSVEKEPKKGNKFSNIENMMEKYLAMKSKQAEEESAELAKEKEAQGADFSIKRCIRVLSAMGVSKEEKAKAYAVLKLQENRELFLCACDDDPESAMLWLRNEMAKK